MSFNLRVDTVFDLHNNWNFRRDLVVWIIRRFKPDILGTQECLAGQADYLRRNLPEYRFVGAGRSDGRRSGEMCGIFFLSRRFQLLDQGHLWLSTTPTVPGSRSWGMFPRMVTWVELRSRHAPFDRLFVFNTHLSFNDAYGRYEQALLLRRAIGRIAGPAPVIVTGDFNTTETSRPYFVLTGPDRATGRSLFDAYRQAHPRPAADEATLHKYRGSTRGQRIDWILSTADFTCLRADIDRTGWQGRYPSDHYPVTAVLRWWCQRLARSAGPPARRQSGPPG